MKLITVIFALCLTGTVSAQAGISVGASMLNGFGRPTPYGGFHLGVEVPRDDAVSIYARLTHHFKHKTAGTDIQLYAIELTTLPFLANVGTTSSFNYTMLEGGTRYYIGNGYDFGWAGYGGTNIMLAFNSVKTDVDEYNETLYESADDYRGKGSIVNLGVGLSGGVKYTIAGVGTPYFDIGVSYIIMAMASNTIANDGALVHASPLLFNFSLGFRKDLIW